jgi:hypothetical protein
MLIARRLQQVVRLRAWHSLMTLDVRALFNSAKFPSLHLTPKGWSLSQSQRVSQATVQLYILARSVARIG